MKLHEIEIASTNYEEILSGVKSFHEIADDPNYQVSDLVHFKKKDVTGVVTNTDELYKITYVLRNSDKLASNSCVLNIKKLDI